MLRFLKGPAWRLRGKTVSVIAQLGATDAELVGCYCTARPLTDKAKMVVFVCALGTLKQDSEVMGFFQLKGGNLKCLGRRREEEGVEESRTEALSGLSRGGWGDSERGGRDGRKTNFLFLHVGFELQMASKRRRVWI